jgi:hypothetical protein
MSENKLMVGGQAVIEGVMMRTPQMVAVACRRADGTITVLKKPYRSLLDRFKLLSFPIFRGAIVLIEALVLGLQALTWSGDLAEKDLRASTGETDPNGKPAPQRGRFSSRPRLVFLSAAGAHGLVGRAQQFLVQPGRWRHPARVFSGISRLDLANEGYSPRVRISRRRAQEHFQL